MGTFLVLVASFCTIEIAEAETRELAWVGAAGGDDVELAWMEIEELDDGNVGMRGVSVTRLEPIVGEDYRITHRLAEEAVLAPDGTVLSWVQNHEHTFWDATFRYRYELVGRQLSITHGERIAVQNVPGDEPIILAPWPISTFFIRHATSPFAATVWARAMSAGSDSHVVYPWLGRDNDVLHQDVPSCGRIGPYRFMFDEFCWDDDGTVESYQGWYTQPVEAVATLDRPDVDFFEVDPGTLDVVTPDCTIPAEGDPLHRTFLVTSEDGTSIAGRMILPTGLGPFPAIVINSGSGGAPRDGSGYAWGSPLPFWDCMAAHLTALGIAVVSYDDRGRGESDGHWNYEFGGRMEDAAAVAEWAAAEPDVGALFFFGHSLGSTHTLGALSLTSEVDGFILASGPALPGVDFGVAQFTAYLTEVGADQQWIDFFVNDWLAFADLLASGAVDGTVQRGYSVDHYWKPLMVTDPIELALATTGPVMIAHGGLDWQVPIEQGRAMADALIAAGRSVTVYEDPLLGHYLQPAIDGLAVGNEYGLPWAFDPALLDAVADFVLTESALIVP